MFAEKKGDVKISKKSFWKWCFRHCL